MLRGKLLERRSRRVRPGLDDKILADWNGLMIAALVDAGLALHQPEWIDLARAAFDFIAGSMTRDGGGPARLGHSFRAGRLVWPGMASDYANMMRAALALAEAGAGRARRRRSRSGEISVAGRTMGGNPRSSSPRSRSRRAGDGGRRFARRRHPHPVDRRRCDPQRQFRLCLCAGPHGRAHRRSWFAAARGPLDRRCRTARAGRAGSPCRIDERARFSPARRRNSDCRTAAAATVQAALASRLSTGPSACSMLAACRRATTAFPPTRRRARGRRHSSAPGNAARCRSRRPRRSRRACGKWSPVEQ